MQPVIQTVELSKNYKDFWGRGHVRALDSLNLEINSGEVFGLLGPNGSGKTTTVKLILGLLFPTKGVVRVFGKSPREVEVKKRIGYMPEESHLYDYLNARETLDFYGRLFGLTRADRQQRTEALIDMVGLGRARHRPIGEFSKGMARRIGLAQALVNDPDLVILDEPTTGLDPIGAKEIKDLIITLRQRGKTIFLCSHLLSDVEQVCDRIAILYGGKMRKSGPVSELLMEEEQMQMRLPPIPAEGIEEVRQTIKKYTSLSDDFEITASERRLEDFFLGVVEQAKREHVDTAGAERGTGAADFLTARETAPEHIIEDLTKAGKTQVKGREGEADQDAPAEEDAPDEHAEDTGMIDHLTAKTDKKREKRKEEKSQDTPDSGLPEEDKQEERRDVLEELVTKKGDKNDDSGDGH